MRLGRIVYEHVATRRQSSSLADEKAHIYTVAPCNLLVPPRDGIVHGARRLEKVRLVDLVDGGPADTSTGHASADAAGRGNVSCLEAPHATLGDCVNGVRTIA